MLLHFNAKQLIWEEENRRLEELLRRKPCSPALPLVVVCPVPANERVEEHFVRRCLNIDDLILGGLINDMSLCVLPYGDEDLPEGIDVANPEISEKVREAL